MRLVVPPGVYRPRSDTDLLLGAVVADRPAGPRVLELCTGTGAVGLGLAKHGYEVVLVDVARRAAFAARVNARLNRVRADVRRGDLFGVVADQRFDVIVANPPYLPAPPDEPARRAARAWDAGVDGRAVIDRICGESSRHLTRTGSLYLLQSSLSDVDATLQTLKSRGLREPTIIASHQGPLGPIAAARAEYLAARGHQRGSVEELVVIRARAVSTVEHRPDRAEAVA